MATILTKKSDTASAVPLAADLTNATGGAELAVNATDKRLFSKTSGGTVVELGTNPSSLTLPNGTANGLAFLNASKVVTSGSALTFDGTNLGVGIASPTFADGKGIHINNAVGSARLHLTSQTSGSAATDGSEFTVAGSDLYIINNESAATIFYNAGSEQMRLTSTGLGIGTSSPSSKLTVASTGSTIELKQNGTGAATYYVMDNTIETGGKRWRFGYTGGAGIPCFSLYNQTDNVVSWVADASGNLGLGVTPSAWNASIKAMEMPDSGFLAFANTNGNISTNTFFDTSYKYKASAFAARYSQSSGQHLWFTAPSGTAGNAITFTQAMTLTASGELLVGLTSGAKFSVSYGGNDTHFGLGANYDNYITAGSSGVTIFRNATTERARIDSSGNFSVGNTAAAYVQLQPAGNVRGIHASGAGGDTILGAINGVSNGYQISVTTGNAQTYKWYNGGTQSMTLDASGNLGVGVTSPSVRLHAEVTSSTNAGAAVAIFRQNGSGNNGIVVDAASTPSNYVADFRIANSSVARIDSSGNLLVGTTSANGLGGTTINSGYALWNSSSNNTTRLFFWYNGSAVGTVTTTGTATSYNTSSDQRLKENIQNADSASAIIDALQVRKFDWKSDNSHQRYGFIAQELVTVAPEAVHQPEDANEMMAVDYSKLVPMLVKEVQSLRKRLADAGL